MTIKKPQYKWDFAIGTTSRVPGSSCMHYLILDFDGSLPNFWPIRSQCVLEKTPHGWHVYTNYMARIETVIALAEHMGADPEWLRIGEKRGYLFLADKSEVKLPWPVERMAIWWKK